MSLSALVSEEVIGGKRVFTFDSHHLALIPWQSVSQAHGFNVQLLTLDHHTDTRSAFCAYACQQMKGHDLDQELIAEIQSNEIDKLDRSSIDSVEAAIFKLKHDEHIDAAIASGILTNAYVISYWDGGHIVSDQEIAERSRRSDLYTIEAILAGPIEVIGPYTYTLPANKIVILEKRHEYDWLEDDPDGFDRPYRDAAVESRFLRERLERIEGIRSSIGLPSFQDRPYILDIDLDYFASRQAANPSDPEEFHKLIRGASAITIAREQECIVSCRLNGETITAEYLEAVIKGHIHDALI
jgi:hypothetical protein